MTINSFSGEYRFLSNFFEAPFNFGGYTYPTSEHAFAAMKTTDPEERRAIRDLETPGQAKRAGRNVTLREDWEDVKKDIMNAIVWEKFLQNPDLKEKLLATGDEFLVEGNTWGDKVWGVCDGEGMNWLGEILMRLRYELRQR